MQRRIISDVSAEPVTLAVLKNYVKYTGSDSNEEALITSMGKSARELCEKYSGLTFAEKSITCYIDIEDLDDRNRVTLPDYPIISIDNVYEVDNEENETEIEQNTGYYLEGMTEKELYFPKTIKIGVDVETELNYKVEYKAGYGDEETEDLPEVLKVAIMKQVAEWYENRENWIPVLNSEVMNILQSYCETVWLG
jgi:uncharacterized phiE125 gp8 family phage protein